MADTLATAPVAFEGFESFRPYLTLLATVLIQRQTLAKPFLVKLDPEDLVQEAMLRAWRFRDQQKSSKTGEILAWLRQILANVLVSHLRAYLGVKRNIRLEVSMDLQDSSCNLQGLIGLDTTLTPSSRMSMDEEVARVSFAVMQLDETSRSVILARHMEGLPFGQIASQMGKSADAVMKIWARAVSRLREHLVAIP